MRQLCGVAILIAGLTAARTAAANTVMFSGNSCVSSADRKYQSGFDPGQYGASTNGYSGYVYCPASAWTWGSGPANAYLWYYNSGSNYSTCYVVGESYGSVYYSSAQYTNTYNSFTSLTWNSPLSNAYYSNVHLRCDGGTAMTYYGWAIAP